MRRTAVSGALLGAALLAGVAQAQSKPGTEAGREQFETVKQAMEPMTEKVKEVVEPLVSEKQRASSETEPHAGPKSEGI